MNSQPSEQSLNDEENTGQAGNDSSDDEDAYGKLVNLQQVKKFLINSQSFRAFQQRFKLMVEPEDQEEVVAVDTIGAQATLTPEIRPSSFRVALMVIID